MLELVLVKKSPGIFAGWIVQREVARWLLPIDLAREIQQRPDQGKVFDLNGAYFLLASESREVMPHGRVMLSGGDLREVEVPLSAAEVREGNFGLRLVMDGKVIAEAEVRR